MGVCCSLCPSSAALCLFQLSVVFRSLVKTTHYEIEWGNKLRGFCCDENKIYCVQKLEDADAPTYTYWLAVYDMKGRKFGSLSLLDKVEVGDVPWDCRPRVDSLHRVYVPCGGSGVKVFSCQDGHLIPARNPLRCVRNACSICVNTADTVFVGDWYSDSVYLVSVSTDTVIRRLETPAEVQGYPHHMSVLGQNVLFCYADNTLVTYHSDSPTPFNVLQKPEGLREVGSMTTDSRASFLITDWSGGPVYVLDDRLLWHRIYTAGYGLRDSAVVESQIWLGFDDGHIDVLASQ